MGATEVILIYLSTKIISIKVTGIFQSHSYLLAATTVACGDSCRIRRRCSIRIHAVGKLKRWESGRNGFSNHCLFSSPCDTNTWYPNICMFLFHALLWSVCGQVSLYHFGLPHRYCSSALKHMLSSPHCSVVSYDITKTAQNTTKPYVCLVGYIKHTTYWCQEKRHRACWNWMSPLEFKMICH